MTTKFPRLQLVSLGLTLLLAMSQTSPAQTNLLPTVTIHATSGAAEPGFQGSFTVFRDGPTNYSLYVAYGLGGTASNGVDYAALDGFVTIPVGSHTAAIVVKPIDDDLVEGSESVVATLTQSLVGNSPAYRIGFPSNAVILIADNDLPTTNHPPVVRILSPTNGSVFLAPADITLVASAYDPENGYNISVEFFNGTNSLGLATFIPSLCPSPYCPNFALMWSNVPPGIYLVSAKATDKNGVSSFSDQIRISVLAGELPKVTIVATDPHASEGSTSGNAANPGLFTVYRTGSTNEPMQVFYHIGGTASNGVDYGFISNSVVIPAGAASATISINPIDDSLVEGVETVEIAIQPIGCIAIVPPPPGCYQPGYPAAAVVFIEDNDVISNAPPRVHLISPTNNATFQSGAVIEVTAEATDVDDAVVRVDFFANDHFLGGDPGTNQGVYGIIWSNTFPGFYLLQARAVDSRGAVGFSDPVRISILGTNTPPPVLPVVTIFAADAIAAEGTNWWRWYSNSIGVLPDYFPTNTATFVVRRAGPTNATLAVEYQIGGTASNGVDYALLPGVVIIPAGERSARIVVWPIDDSLPECAETVILKLQQPTNVPPAYLVGWPAKAAAIILDNDQTPPQTCWLCDGTFHLCLPGTNGFTYRLECSLDLLHWLPVGTTAVTDLGIHFVDPESQDFPNRFYRVVAEPALTP